MKADLPDTKVVFKVGWQDGRQYLTTVSVLIL